ncbi:DUF4129 domain-containing protein [bacterium]|nr:DUF4129 domain-containing protein [bacterium]
MRPRLTEIDYAIIAVAPALIMVLVGSLMLFLAGLTYQGPHEYRIILIICMFVLGIVSLARVHIEEGIGKSGTLAAGFSSVMMLAVWRFVPDAMVMAALMLVGIWWISTRLVYDCTVLEQSVDASQKGLMQWIRKQPEAETTQASQPEEPQIEGVTGGEEESVQQQTFLEKLDAWFNPTNTKFAPGAWVVYFSLAALPIFGFGQALGGDLAESRRWYLFLLLVAYVFAALSLLVTTSFLGLRRYLQQRGVEMPLSMTGTWLGVGFTVVAVVLVVVSILPRPNAEYDLAKVPSYQDEHERQASRYATNQDATKDNREDRAKSTDNQDQADENSPKSNETRKDGKEPGNKTDSNAKQTKSGKSKDSSKQQGKSSDQKSNDQQKSDSKQNQSTDGKQQDQSNDSKQSEGAKQNEGSQQSQGDQKSDSGEKSESNDDSSSDKSSEENSSDEKSQESESSKSQSSDQSQQASQPPPSSSLPSLPSLGNALKLLIYALVAGAGIFFAWKFWDDIVKAWNEFWESLFGGKSSTEEKAEQPEVAPAKPRVAFSSFRNPFQDPRWKGKPLEEWVRYSFSALEAWAAERGSERSEEQTPGEFATMLENQFLQLDEIVRPAADLYGQVAYGSGKAPRETLDILRKLWESLTRSA